MRRSVGRLGRYVHTALQGGSITHSWANDDRIMIACGNDGTRPVVFKLERIDIPETDDGRAWLAERDFSDSAEGAYIGQARGASGGTSQIFV